MDDRLDPQQEQQQIERARHDRQAFRPLYRAYVERIYSYVAYRVGNPQDAEDIVSDVFTRAMTKLDQYDGQYPFVAWLFGIARHAVIDHYRSDSRAPDIIPFDNAPPLAEDDLPPESQLTRQEQAGRVRAAIELLSERRRDVLTLRYYGGMSNKEIAALLELDERTVASHISRALDDLQAFLAGEEAHHEQVI
jgi:RNA polymerase sigma-70 factor (ECF subfamily)